MDTYLIHIRRIFISNTLLDTDTSALFEFELYTFIFCFHFSLFVLSLLITGMLSSFPSIYVMFCKVNDEDKKMFSSLPS